MKKKCPTCNSRDGVREFLYGMPSEEPDPSKYVLGGCCFSDDRPDYRCIKCATDFYKDGAKYHNKFVSDGTGISWLCKKCNEWFPALDSHACEQKVDPWKDY